MSFPMKPHSMWACIVTMNTTITHIHHKYIIFWPQS